ncbi:MAG: 5-formyltetrahydrofolate cyclo-ligase [Verrucomicrobiota bacterium]|nr:5-formyltetrahydrofolate cyclo-ligase [Verrucomicrobiota bacterium]MDP6752850.1 5-formyltetrahydrofolate cyclo-ligase [Verrucomicrobiota bacterium]MDP7012358.1 5-formyltetrahydrofolate cyclo-ligase [Verrucomicrobiota bacterium]
MNEPGTNSEARLAKRLAREELRLTSGGLSLGQAMAASEAVCRLILESAAWREAGQAMLYMATPGELDLNQLLINGLETGKKIALPRYSAKKEAYEACALSHLSDLVPGKFGILEPPEDSPIMDTMQLDLAIVGGVAFDRLGGRLGRGGGFFDRLLAGIPAAKCGVCLDEQVRRDVPVERHDVKMDMIATPSGWLVPPPA